VPAVILILAVWPQLPDGALYALAVLSTLAGNLFLVGSLANLIVVERAQSVGVTLSFRDHAKSGVPITLLSSAAAILWLWLTGVLPLF
jgi:Na+/H+ antiporter NhaD/arsenite permease-like protein